MRCVAPPHRASRRAAKKKPKSGKEKGNERNAWNGTSKQPITHGSKFVEQLTLGAVTGRRGLVDTDGPAHEICESGGRRQSAHGKGTLAQLEANGGTVNLEGQRGILTSVVQLVHGLGCTSGLESHEAEATRAA